MRDVFSLTMTLALPAAASFASRLADFYDDQICGLVARIEADDPALLPQIRGEALSARMIAVLNAIERHTAALTSATSASRDANTFLSGYRRQAIEQHGKLQPPDFERRRRVPIADIYVPAIIYEEVSSERTVDPSQPLPSLTVWELGERADRSVLLGDPGGGKTTASNVLMHHFASDPARRVPFLVTLRDFAASNPPERSVVGYIEREFETFYQCPAPPGLVDMLLLTGRAIVFFDGLDELLDTSRRADVATRVERFCTEYPLAPVLVTSRMVGYDQARLDDRQFTCYRLCDFRDKDVADYARKWFALEPNARSDEADAFLSESESVPDLRSNPLLLSLMCILYRGEGSLPRNRAGIYEQCATLLFRKWDARRSIHQDLRAGYLVEPALRHLAWWLFTREDTNSAVTERDLINAATEFLHGRGFEAEDDARDAAREFIEFCRGRMWVFSDMGTAATGEKLYSFTHRTFLEYFAAAQLAFDSDTPDNLAHTITHHVAQGEWEIVAELAVQIKDSTSTEGAKRVYEYLLGERHREPMDRRNILQFLAQTLRSVNPPPRVVRRLAREVIDFMLSRDPADSIRTLPFTRLMGSCDATPTIVNEEIAASIAVMVSSDSQAAHLNGLSLALCLEYGFYIWLQHEPGISRNNQLSTFWADRGSEYRRKYKKNIITAAAHDKEIRHGALQYELITVEQALKMNGSLLPLFQDQPSRIFPIIWSPYLPQTNSTLLQYHKDAKAAREMRAVGRHLAAHPDLPWISGPTSPYTYWKFDIIPKDKLLSFDPLAYLGSAAVTLMTLESMLETNAPPAFRPPHGDSSWLGSFSALYPYIERRHTPESTLPLPDLPVPTEFKQIFRDWAMRKINLTGPSTDAA